MEKRSPSIGSRARFARTEPVQPIPTQAYLTVCPEGHGFSEGHGRGTFQGSRRLAANQEDIR